MSPNKYPLTICYVAGKSGGHIVPCLTLAKNWRAANKDGQVLFISSSHPLDRTLTKNQHITSNYYLSVPDVPHKKIYCCPLFLWRIFISVINSIVILKKTRPTRVVSTGGVVAIPVVLAARILRIPVELWELNVVPGRTIHFLARFATTINVCFTQTKNFLKATTPCLYVCYPTRYTVHDIVSREHAHEQLNLNKNRVTIFIIGGSQGSASLSMIIKQLIDQYPDVASHITCIHQTGSLDTTDWAAFYREHHIPAIVFDYRHNLAPCYNAADIIISRAGAGAIFEAVVFKKPCLLVPLKTVYTAHQVDNARAMAQEHPEYFVHTDEQAAVDRIYEQIQLTIIKK